MGIKQTRTEVRCKNLPHIFSNKNPIIKEILYKVLKKFQSSLKTITKKLKRQKIIKFFEASTLSQDEANIMGDFSLLFFYIGLEVL